METARCRSPGKPEHPLSHLGMPTVPREIDCFQSGRLVTFQSIGPLGSTARRQVASTRWARQEESGPGENLSLHVPCASGRQREIRDAAEERRARERSSVMLFDRFRMKGIAIFATATLALAMTATPTLGAAPAGTSQTALATLFSGTAQVELQEHFAAEAVLAGLVGSNTANLQDSIAGETWEHTTMYPGFAKQATKDKCPAAAALFTEIAVDEGGHAAAYTLALQALTDSAVRVPKPQTVDPVVITASTPACPGTKTQVNLLAAMHGEAFAYAKYTAYALQAARTSQAALATLFSGTAQVELQEHFAAEAVLAGLVGTNAANLQDS